MSDNFELLRDSFRRDLRLRNKADRTIGAYVESTDRFIAWARSRGLTSVTQVTRAHVRAWLGELLDTVSARTTVRHHSGAKQWFKWLHAEDEVESNPFDGVPQPAVPEKPTEVPTVADVRAVLRACSGKTFEERRDHALIMVLADGGPALPKRSDSELTTSTSTRACSLCSARAEGHVARLSGTRPPRRSTVTCAPGRNARMRPVLGCGSVLEVR